MKKYLVGVLVIVTAVTFSFPVGRAAAQAITLQQLVELFISLGIIGSDKAAAARAAVGGTPVVVPPTTSTTTPTVAQEVVVSVLSKSISKNSSMGPNGMPKDYITSVFNISFSSVDPGGPDGSAHDIYINKNSFDFSVYKNGAWLGGARDLGTVSFEIPSSGVTTSGVPNGFLFVLQKNNTVTVPVSITFSPTAAGQALYSVGFNGFNYGQKDTTTGGTAYKSVVWLKDEQASKGFITNAVSAEGQGTVQTTNVVGIVGTPTLDLTYDSANKEALLTATFDVSLTAGSNSLQILKGGAGVRWSEQTRDSAAIEVNSYRTTVAATSQVSEAIDQYGQSNIVVPAGRQVSLRVTSTVNPKQMFAGTYRATLLNLLNVVTSPSYSYSNIALPDNTTPRKTIVGEVSPYVTSVDYFGDVLTIYGARFDATRNIVSVGGHELTLPSSNNGTMIKFIASLNNLPTGSQNVFVINDTLGRVAGLSNVKTVTIGSTGSYTKSAYHSADINKDWKVSDDELNYVTALYNYRSGTVRTGEYSVAAGSSNSDPKYIVGPGLHTGVTHSADTNKDWKLSLNELLRVIELKNATGGYKVQDGTEDGYAPVTKVVSADPTISPNNQTVASGQSVTINFTYPSNTVRAMLYISCPTGAGIGGAKGNITDCNTYADVTNSLSAVFQLINNTSSAINVVPNYYVYTSDNPNYARGVSSSVTVSPGTISTQLPSITVTSPVNSYEANPGNPAPVRWTTSGVTYVKVEACYNNNTQCVVLSPYIAASNGGFTWQFDSNAAYVGKTDVRVKVTDVTSGVSAFGPTIQIVAPSTPAISCTDSDGGQNVNIAGLTDGRVNGIGSYFNDTSVASNGGQCSGTSCTAVAEGYCGVSGVTNTLMACPSGYSVNGACAPAPIVAQVDPTIAPNNQTVASGQSVTINFTYPSNTVRAMLYISCPNGAGIGASKGSITDCNTYADVTNYQYAMFQLVNTTSAPINVVPNYYVYTSDNPNYARGVSSSVTVSPAVNATSVPVGPATITVTSPNGGETMALGQSTVIRWTSSNIPSNLTAAYILLTDANGSDIYYISQRVMIADGSYSWVVGQNSTLGAGTYKIKMAVYNSNTGTFEPYDYSDGSFTITSANSGMSASVFFGAQQLENLLKALR